MLAIRGKKIIHLQALKTRGGVRKEGGREREREEGGEEVGFSDAVRPWLCQFISLSPISSSIKKDPLMDGMRKYMWPLWKL